MAMFSLMSIDELKNRGTDELARLLKASENEKLRLTAEHSRAMKDVNRKLQTYVHEIQNLQEHNQKLLAENEELHDLCCFLDGICQKDQQTVKEWQKFGRYTSDTMQSNVKTFQNKLNLLETKLNGLTKENIQLKELCLLLADDRSCENSRENFFQGYRGAGDGSSSSSPSNEKLPVHTAVADRNCNTCEKTSVVNDDAVQYLQYLENKVLSLEKENKHLLQAHQKFSDRQDYRKFILTAEPSPSVQKPTSLQSHMSGITSSNSCRPISYPKGHILTQNDSSSAMKVLSVHNQVDSPSSGIESQQDVMDESEKAIVRQMCNVVWQKLGDALPGYKTAV